ncbi:kinase-like domain-containing protein [Exophiala viscosa]|uniref:Kinase-like domain-containing protein n=1 Tax=Exophiala viscosa TaxID=2486360 RepID=A0AAN6DU83_9EURO|nr:kinase-like domain-containing protein [Exophiala viscosa]
MPTMRSSLVGTEVAGKAACLRLVPCLHCSQYVIDDPYVSKRHLRLYTVVYENDEPDEVQTLVYAEDLSQNGSYWNGGLIGNGNGGYLISDGDVLRLSRQTFLVFEHKTNGTPEAHFDFAQEWEMARFRNHYVVTDRLLGAGTFGKVFMAIEQQARAQVACKLVDLRRLEDRPLDFLEGLERPAAAQDVDSRAELKKVNEWGGQQKREGYLEDKLRIYLREVEILASVSHPNIIGIEKVYVTDSTVYMMQDLVTAGDLFSYIESKNGRLLEVEAAVIIRQILIALCFLHENNIVHRDIKPENILMTSLSAGSRVVLTDFGAARRIQSRLQRMSTLLGTLEYAAPETLKQSRSGAQYQPRGYTRAVDLWSVGCVSVVLLTGGLAFADPTTNMYSEKLARECNLTFLEESIEWLQVRRRPKDFVENLLVLDEAKRPTAAEALNHPWFSNEMHRNDFEDLYQRTIKHWVPRPPKPPTIEFQDPTYKYLLKRSPDAVDFGQRFHQRHKSPVDPPYKPFPRNMHLNIWPKRDAKRRLSAEVLGAIENWAPDSLREREHAGPHVSWEEKQILSAYWSKNEDKTSRDIRARTVSPPPRPQSEFFIRPPETRTGDTLRSLGSTTKPAAEHRSLPDVSYVKEPSGVVVQDNHFKSPGRPLTPRSQKGGLRRRASSMPPDLVTRNTDILTGRIYVEDEPASNVGDGINANDFAYDSTGGEPSCDPEGEDQSSIMSDCQDTGEEDISAPRKKYRLKRRTNTVSPNRHKKRRGSVFDLAEDDENNEAARKMTTLVNRPKVPIPTKHKPETLYLPR